MNITIIAFGTRGDVQPLLALGKGLEQAGHQVCMVAGANFESWIQQHGLRAATYRGHEGGWGMGHLILVTSLCPRVGERPTRLG